ARLRVDLEELAFEAEPGVFDRELLRGAARRVEVAVERVARDDRPDGARDAPALGRDDGRWRPQVDVADLGVFQSVLGADPDLFQREPAEEVLVAERGQRIERADADARAAAGEVVVVEPPAEDVEGGRERDVEEPGLGEAADEVLAPAAEVGVEHRALTAAE